MIEKSFYVAVGGYLRAGRGSLHLTLDEVARKSGLGLSRSAISSIEQGKQQISLHQFLRITKILGLNPSDIISDLSKNFGEGDSLFENALSKRPKARSLIEAV